MSKHHRILLLLAALLSSSWVQASPGGELSISASASVLRSSDGLAQWATLLTLNVPLDRAAAPVVPLSADEAPTDVEPAREREPSQRRAPVRLLLSPALARATVRAALRASGRPAALRRMDSLSSRSRSSALLPELRLRAERVVDESLRLTPRIDDPYRYTRAGGTSLELEARLTWRLSRLVFADQEIAVERLRVTRSALDARRVERVLAALAAWQKALIIAGDAAEPPRERLLAELAAVEAEALLDVLTDGWFSARVRRLSGGDKGLADPGTTE